MATHNQTGASPITWEIDESNDTWNLGAQGIITVGFSLGEAYGINEAAGQSGNVINIRGDVAANGPWAESAVHIAGQKTQLHVFESAKLTSDTGISSTSAGAVILNEGTIDATDFGINAQDAKRITNAGDITGQYGIASGDSKEVVNAGEIDVNIVGVAMEAGGTVLRNLKGGVIDATSIGVEISGLGTAKIINSGEIIGGLVDHKADLTLINRNHLEGHFDLGTGDDIFDTRKGELVGQVEGGLGNDTFKVSSMDVVVEENFGEGFDRVISSASFELGANIENLILTGAGNANALGNGGDNDLFGNKGNNHLYGNAGQDELSGGAGRDFLNGGADIDIFIFGKKDGKDTIEDFEDGLDIIVSSYIGTVADVNDLLKNHAEQKGDDVVITYGNDRLIIRDLELTDLTKEDFQLL